MSIEKVLPIQGSKYTPAAVVPAPHLGENGIQLLFWFPNGRGASMIYGDVLIAPEIAVLNPDGSIMYGEDSAIPQGVKIVSNPSEVESVLDSIAALGVALDSSDSLTP